MIDPFADPFAPSGAKIVPTQAEVDLAREVYEAMHQFMDSTPRSQQQQRFLLGISDLGTCMERTRRLVAQIPGTDTPDKMAAFIGTAVGVDLEKAIKLRWPEAITQAEVKTTLTADGGEYEVVGHPDIIMPWGVLDGKTVNGLEVTKRVGPSQQQLFQRHLYTKGAHEMGLLQCDLADAKTGNIWVDRSGATDHVHVQLDDYSPDIVAAAAYWLDEVMYHYQRGQEAMKEPPRQWCEKACEHFSTCRLYDSDVAGLITDERLVTATSIYAEGHAMEVDGKRLKDEAKKELIGVSGYTAKHQVRWVTVNGTEARSTYDRISVTKLKGK